MVNYLKQESSIYGYKKDRIALPFFCNEVVILAEYT